MRALKRCCALLLWVHLVTFVQCNDCTLQSFKESNHFHESFELSNLRQRYSSGDTVRVPCKMGYRGFFKITCSQGQWVPHGQRCEEIFCEKPLINNGNAQGDKQKFKENEVLRYSCNLGYKNVDDRPSTCRKLGLTAQWIPRPECELLTCKLNYNPPGTTTYDPQDQLVFRPGQTVRVSCGEKEWVKSKELRSTQIECQDTGLWDFPPECQLVTCSRRAEHVYRWESSWNDVIKMGDTLWYECLSDYDKTTDSRAECTRRGWQPDPLCKSRGCARPSNRDAVITDSRLKERYDHADTVHFQCSYDPDTSFTVTCHFGRWTAGQRCKAKPCTTQPVLDNAVMVDGRKQTYSNGERVRFRCKDKTDIFTVTCHNGEWTTTSNCENLDCTTQPVMDNAEMVGIRTETYINGQRVEFRCSGERNTFRVTCQSGKWISPKQCEERSQCGRATIPNGFSYLVNSKLYYACSKGYKLQKAGWWDEATCVNGQWNEVECIAITDCGPIPAIPHMTETSENSRFSEGDTFPIRCESGYRNLHVGLQSITCEKGKWDSNGVDFKTICTPIEKKCGPPVTVENAVILAPFQKEYLSNTLLTYKCRDNYTIEGEDTVRCINGIWEKKTISCKAKPCTTQPVLDNAEMVDREKQTYSNGEGVSFRCKDETEITVTCHIGEWRTTSNCENTCDVLNVPDSVEGVTVLPTQLTKGQFLQFRCKNSEHVLQGSADVTCLENGQWSHPFPTCRDSRDCGPAPLLENGDTLTSSNMEFAHNARVEYQCQNMYKMEGGPFKTCLNGEWTGEIKCLKPCTLDPTVMDPQNIEFKRKLSNKLHLPHNTGIDFFCKTGTTHDGRVEMRQFCRDGQMLLPTCH